MTKRTIIIASGGTGGHLYPTIAVAEYIREARADLDIVFVGTRDRMESKEVPRAGFQFHGLDIEAPRKSVKSMVLFPVKMVRAIMDCLALYRRVNAIAFLGGGAYLSVPAGIAAWIKGLPIALLEINSIAGSANKLLSKIASHLFLAYPESKKEFGTKEENITISGTPVRSTLGGEMMEPVHARKEFCIDPERPTVLVFGGSLGAKAINEAMAQDLPRFLEHGVNVIWQTGKSYNAEEIQSKYPSDRVWVREYIFEMEKAYSAADLVICRAGASSLAELGRLGKPAILVPYPLAADNHQEKNAVAFESRGAAVVLRDRELKEKLAKVALDLMVAEPKRSELAKNMRLTENREAAKLVGDWLMAHGMQKN